MWYEEGVMYQIYPLGLCGAPERNAELGQTGTDWDRSRDGQAGNGADGQNVAGGQAGIETEAAAWQQQERDKHRILRVLDWIPHIKELGATCIMFNPVFESDAHGYDTRDYNLIDCRLGTNEDFKQVCKAIHDAGMKVMLDGVFNHTGRGFMGFRDVQKNRWDSQ